MFACQSILKQTSFLPPNTSAGGSCQQRSSDAHGQPSCAARELPASTDCTVAFQGRVSILCTHCQLHAPSIVGSDASPKLAPFWPTAKTQQAAPFIAKQSQNLQLRSFKPQKC